jgi:nucleotide-binding universal stress UspA family protein
MYKQILVALDGSDTSILALNEAIKLAKDQHSALRLIHVLDPLIVSMVIQQRPGRPPVEAPNIVEYRESYKAAAQKIIADGSATARQAGIEPDAALVVLNVHGQHIYDVIEHEAKRWRADLIVIGSHGRRGTRRLLLGSVAEGLTRVASKPVLLVRGRRG